MDLKYRANSESSFKFDDQYPINKFETIVTLTYIEIMSLLLIFFITSIIIIIYIIVINRKEIDVIQMLNGLFNYVCPVTNTPIIINIIELILLLYHVSKMKTVFSGRYIYMESRFICLISISWIILDPGTKVGFLSYKPIYY